MTLSSADVSDRISVMTMNLRFGLADDGPNRWEMRKPRIAALFERHRPDLVAFQEANGFQIDFLRELLSEYRDIGQRRPAPDFWQNNIIFHRRSLACVVSDHFYLSHTPGIPSRFAESRWPRQCTMGVFERDRRRLIAVNTHLDFDESVQRKSAELILDRLGRHPSTLPALLLGDFNASPGSACHRVFTEGSADSDGKGCCFKPLFAPAYPGTHHDFSGRSDGRHIDWILYRGDLEPVSRQVCRLQTAGGYPSDHFPLCAEFAWPAPKNR